MTLATIERKQPRIGAFFDMDKTILSDNSATLYMRYRYERGEMSKRDLMRGLGAYFKYKIGILDIRSWTLDMMVQFSGQSEKQLEEEAIAWVEAAVVETIYPEAARLVDEHLAESHVVAIVSGATAFVVRPIATHLGIEHILYTRLEVENGLFTGRVIEPICFEEGKIYWLQQFIEEQGSIWRRATSTATRSPICRCSISSAIPSQRIPTHCSIGRRSSVVGRFASSIPRTPPLGPTPEPVP